MNEWILVGLVVLLIGANAVFVAAEFALVTIDRSAVQRRAEQGDRRAAGLQVALKSLSTQLSGAQLGITITSLVVGFIAEPSIAALLRGPIGATGLPDSATNATAFAVAFIVATGAQMVFGELVPKNWAIAEPMRVGSAVAGLQRGFTTVSGPLIRLLNGMANTVLRAFGIEPAEELASARSPGELTSLASRSAEHGTLEVGTAQLLARSIEFGDRRAADVMTPRPRVRFIAAQQPVATVLSQASSTGHARFPVIGDGADDVIGMAHFKHALRVPAARRDHTPVEQIVHALPAVPASMELRPLLRLLRRSGPQMALVVDEYGGTDGIVTLEDLVEEIVGDIEDEQDRPLRRVRTVTEGEWSLSGLLRPDELEDLTGLSLPEPEEADRLGGLIAERLGRLPGVGDVIELEARDLTDRDPDGVPNGVGVTLQVIRMDGRRVDRVRLRRHDSGRADTHE